MMKKAVRKTNRKGILIVFSGPSGCGKGTVLKELMAQDANIFYSISATTRKPVSYTPLAVYKRQSYGSCGCPGVGQAAESCCT